MGIQIHSVEELTFDIVHCDFWLTSLDAQKCAGELRLYCRRLGVRWYVWRKDNSRNDTHKENMPVKLPRRITPGWALLSCRMHCDDLQSMRIACTRSNSDDPIEAHAPEALCPTTVPKHTFVSRKAPWPHRSARQNGMVNERIWRLACEGQAMYQTQSS